MAGGAATSPIERRGASADMLWRWGECKGGGAMGRAREVEEGRRAIRVPSGCWRRLAGAMPTCPIERRTASDGVRVRAPLKETLRFGRRCADLTGRTSLRAASGVARSGDGAVERPTAKDRAYHGCPAYRARKRPLRGLQPPTPLRSWAGFWPRGEPCVIGAPSVRCCRVARAVAKTPIARRAERDDYEKRLYMIDRSVRCEIRLNVQWCHNTM